VAKMSNYYLKFFNFNQLLNEETSLGKNLENYFENFHLNINLTKKKYFFDDYLREKNIGKRIFFSLAKSLKIIKRWRLTPNIKKNFSSVKTKKHIKKIQKKLSDHILKFEKKKKLKKKKNF
jgi:hypothetical protein